MRSSTVFSIVSLLAQQASVQAGSVETIGHGSYVATRMRRKADIDLNSGDYLKRHVHVRRAEPAAAVAHREAAPAPSGNMAAVSAATGPVNLNPMMNETQMACNQALMSAKPTDDSGMAACFNINFFDNSTGAYQANVLLYMLAPPTGNWSSLQKSGVPLSLSFPGASSRMEPQVAQKAKRDATSTPSSAATPIRRTISARSGAPMMMEAYTIRGSVQAPFNASLTNSTAMREALTPVMTITAMSSNNMNLTGKLTAPMGAAFVNGFFSDAFVAQKAAEAAAAANPPPFVLPGTYLAIDKGLFPIGLIVTSIWVGFFLIIVGYGTFERAQWRKAYRAKKPNASGK